MTQCTRVANDAVDPARDQPVPGLDGNQPAEAVSEHDDGPEPQRAAGREERDAKPAHGVPVKRPKLPAVRIRGQKGGQQSEEREHQEDPAVRAVLALARAQVALGEERRAGQRKGRHGDGGARRMGKEGPHPAEAKDREAEEYHGGSEGDDR